VDRAQRQKKQAAKLARAVDRIVAFVRSGRDVVTSRSLAAAGHSPHYVAIAVSRGRVVRVRPGWIATPEADPLLVAAARAGAVLTCITEARRLELWVLAEDRLHLGAPATSGGVRSAGAHIHWAAPPIPRAPGVLEDPIENVLAIVARCQPHDVALAIWESALRKGLVTVDALRRLPLGPAARALCEEAVPWSDSGLESFVAPRLRWLGLSIRAQTWVQGHRVDFLIGERLVLQIDGGHHVGAQRAEDVAHDAALLLMGYHVIRVTYAQMVDGWPAVQEQIMRAVAQGLHRAPRP